MKTLIPRPTAVATLLLLTSPVMLSAHEGHAGAHGWLAGATQPLLSLDHFLAGLFVAVAGAVGVAALGRRTRLEQRAPRT